MAQHSGAFAEDALTRTEGHSFECSAQRIVRFDGRDGTPRHPRRFTELHGEYLRLFEKATERVLEVCGGTREAFMSEVRDAFRSGRRGDDVEQWFLDATIAALEYEVFYETMAAAGRRRAKK